MKKTFLFMLLLLAIVLSTYAAQDSKLLADYEPNTTSISSTVGWVLSDISVVANPESETVNSSDSVLKFTRSTQWSSAVEFTDFGNISLFQRPLIKLKVRSDSTVSKVIQIMVTDVNNYSTSVQGAMPDQDSTWEEITIDFTDKLKSTPISFINKVVVQIDYGQPVAAGAVKNVYYIDEIQFAGEPVDVTENDTLLMYEETFSENAWWDGLVGDPDGDGTGAIYTTLSFLRTAAWGGSALTGSAEHYIGSDSLKYVRQDWSGGVNAASVYPSATRSGLSDLEIVDFDIAGKGSLVLTYDLQWITAPAAYTDAPTVEYKLDGGDWTALSSSSTLPSGLASAATLIYPLTGVSGDAVDLRVTNNTSGRCYIDNLIFTGKLVFADSLIILASDDSIKVNNGTIQLTSTVYPLSARQIVEWSIVGGTGKAEFIDTVPGLLMGKANGTVMLRARALDIWGEVFSNTITINMINQNPVDSIIVSADTKLITVDGGTLQMNAEVIPFDSASPFDSSVTWSTNSTIATIDDNGLLTAVGNGVVVITATADDGSSVYGKDTITISNQWANFIVANKIDAPNITDDTDYNANVDMMWDDSTIHVTLSVIDDKIFNDGGDVWVVDNTEIYFDMENGKLVSWPRTSGWPPAFENGIEGYYQLRVLPEKSWSSQNTLGGVDLTFNVDITATGDTVGYTYKLVFALDSLQEGFTPIVGKEIGFDILTSDNDGDPDYRDQVSLNSPTGLVYVDPSLWGTFQFEAGGVFTIISDETAPSKPVVTATASGFDVIVSWDPSTDNIAVFEYIVLENGLAIDTVPAALEDNGILIGNLVNGSSNSYAVIAVDNYGNMSDTSDVAYVTINHIAVTDLTIGGGNIIDTKGGTLQMTVTITPDDATDKSVIWSVDNESVATIDSTTGLLTAVADGTVLVKATSNDDMTISDLIEVTISNQTTGIHEPIAAKFKVYPNPANDILYVTSEKIIESITVTNIIGEVVIHKMLKATDATLNVKDLNSGTYFITVEAGHASSTGIFIVK